MGTDKAIIYKIKKIANNQGKDEAIIKLTGKTHSSNRNMLNEANILRELEQNQKGHPNIVSMHDVYSIDHDNRQYVILCLERCEMNLLDKIPTQLNEDGRGKVFEYIKQIVDAMCYIHDK
jgi:serine/threonine protein kinase